MFLTAQTWVRVSVILCQVEQTFRYTQELQNGLDNSDHSRPRGAGTGRRRILLQRASLTRTSVR